MCIRDRLSPLEQVSEQHTQVRQLARAIVDLSSYPTRTATEPE